MCVILWAPDLASCFVLTNFILFSQHLTSRTTERRESLDSPVPRPVFSLLFLHELQALVQCLTAEDETLASHVYRTQLGHCHICASVSSTNPDFRSCGVDSTLHTA